MTIMKTQHNLYWLSWMLQWNKTQDLTTQCAVNKYSYTRMPKEGL